MSRHSTLGEAKKAARNGVKADEAEWKVYYQSRYIYDNKHYIAQPAIEPVAYGSVTKFIWSTKEDEKARHQKIELDMQIKAAQQKLEIANKNTVVLDQDEKELLEYILRPGDKDRDFWPGTDKTKDSLWNKMKKALA